MDHVGDPHTWASTNRAQHSQFGSDNRIKQSISSGRIVNTRQPGADRWAVCFFDAIDYADTVLSPSATTPVPEGGLNGLEATHRATSRDHAAVLPRAVGQGDRARAGALPGHARFVLPQHPVAERWSLGRGDLPGQRSGRPG